MEESQAVSFHPVMGTRQLKSVLLFGLLCLKSQAEAEPSRFSFDHGFEDDSFHQEPIRFEPQDASCPPGQILVEKPNGMTCMQDYSALYKPRRVQGKGKSDF